MCLLYRSFSGCNLWPSARSHPPATSPVIETRIDPTSARFEANMRFLADMVSQVRNEEEKIREGGGAKAIENQHNKKRADRAGANQAAGGRRLVL